MAAREASVFIFGGRSFRSFAEFSSAVATSEKSRAHPSAKNLVGPDSKAELSRRVRFLFGRFSEDGADVAAKDFAGLAVSVAAELGLDPMKFLSLSDAFDRFDINGDGRLDEEECVMLAESMLRIYAHDMLSKHVRKASLNLRLERRSLESRYEILEKLGQGGQGSVHLARDRGTKEERVVKIYDKSNANAPVEEIEHEFHMLRCLDHPRIQRLYDMFEDRSNVYVVSEPYYGGNLANFVEHAFDSGVHVTMTYLAKAVHQVLQGVAYLHSHYITHCDLKEPNIMVASADEFHAPSLVVIDFGLAHSFAARGLNGGTPGYMPPEVWTKGLWTPKGDVHSLGVIMYHLYSNGTRCFRGRGDEEVRRKTLRDMPDFDAVLSSWPRSKDLLPLLERMLQKDLHQRPTVKQCMEHDFFARRLFASDDDEEDVLPEDVLASLRDIGERSRLARAVYAGMASKQNLAGLRELNAAFDAMDTDHDGVLTEEEVRVALLSSGAGGAEIEHMVQNLVGTDGCVAYTSFMGHLINEKAIDEGRLVLREFEELDVDQTGYLDLDEVALLLEKPALASILGARTPEELLARMDLDGDGRVVFEEFRRALVV